MVFVKEGKTTFSTDIVIDDEGDIFIMVNMGGSFISLANDDIDDATLVK